MTCCSGLRNQKEKSESSFVKLFECDCRRQAASGVKFVTEVTEPGLMDDLIMNELHGNLKVLSVDACTRAFRSVILSNSAVSTCMVIQMQLECLHSQTSGPCSVRVQNGSSSF